MDDKTKGKIKQGEGKAQEMWGDLKEKADEAKDKVEDRFDDDDERETTETTTTTTTTDNRLGSVDVQSG